MPARGTCTDLQWQRDIEDEKASFELESEMYDFEDSSNWWIDIWGCFDLYDSHVYDGGRCVYCNSDIYDNIIYGDDGCVPDRELMMYTVESTP